MAETKSYFPHDSNARNDEKIIRLRMRHKATGYGVYWMILERLREEENYMSLRDYNVIAFDIREDTSLIKSVVEDFGLFSYTDDGKYFYSESFRRRMEIKDEKARRRSEAGKKGMEKRWSNNVRNNNNNVITPIPVTYPDEKELTECMNELASDQSWTEALIMNTRSSGYKDFYPEDFNRYLDTFFRKLVNEGETTKSPKDAKSHFARWLKLELEHEKDKRNNNDTKQEANEYAVRQFASRVAAAQKELPGEDPKPF